MGKTIFILALLSNFSIVFSQNTDGVHFKTDNKIIYDICFTDKGGAIGIADNNTIKTYSTISELLLNEFKNGHTGQILTIDISKDSTLLVSGGKDSTIVIWDFISGKILNSLTYQKGIITSVKISPDQKYLASGGTDNKVFLYDLRKNEVTYEFTDHIDIITSVAFSPDGKLIVSSSADKMINIYDVETRKLISHLEGHRNWVRDISFNANGLKLASCGDDAKVIFWDVSDINNIQKQKTKRIGFEWIISIDFSHGNDTYVTGGVNGKALIFTKYSRHTAKMGVHVNRVLFKPNEGDRLKIALATRGKGVVMLEADKIKFQPFSEIRSEKRNIVVGKMPSLDY